MFRNVNQTSEIVLYIGMILIVCLITSSHVESIVITLDLANSSYMAQSRTYPPLSESGT